MGFAYHFKLEKATEYFSQYDSRQIVIPIAARGGPIKFHNFYAPQSGKPLNERIKYFDEVAAHISCPKGHIKNMYLGDFNAQLHGRHKFGKSIEYVEKKEKIQTNPQQRLADRNCKGKPIGGIEHLLRTT